MEVPTDDALQWREDYSRKILSAWLRAASIPRRFALAARGVELSHSVLVESGVRATGRVSAISVGPQTVIERRSRLTVSAAAAASGAHLRIGARVLIGEGSYLTAHKSLDVGDDVLIAAGCYVTEANHGLDRRWMIRNQPSRAESVSIGPGAWLGAHVVVLPGVNIGEGAVIGAGSVVTGDVPPFAIFAGVPARRIGER